MRRRDFIKAVVGAVTAWPLAARAQDDRRVRYIGVLLPADAEDPVWQARLGAFLQALALFGWTIGRNVRIDILWATPDPANIRKRVAELVALAPDIILAGGSSIMGPLLQATRTVPIVFTQRSSRVRLGGQLGAAWRQRHRFHVI